MHPVAILTLALYLQIDGAATEGGATGSFQQIVDTRSGQSRTTRVTGPMRSISGFDGVHPWVYGNGIATLRDLPASVSKARAEAFVARLGWLDSPETSHFNLPGSDPIEIVRAGGRTTVTIDADEGPEAIVLDDWRKIGDLEYPFSQVTTDDVGETTSIAVERVMPLASVAPDAFTMPPPQPHGTLTGRVTVPFAFVGKRDSHLLVSAKVNGNDTRLIFDSGGANYFGIEAAKQWGITVSGGLNIGGPGTGASAVGSVASVRSASAALALMTRPPSSPPFRGRIVRARRQD